MITVNISVKRSPNKYKAVTDGVRIFVQFEEMQGILNDLEKYLPAREGMIKTLIGADSTGHIINDWCYGDAAHMSISPTKYLVNGQRFWTIDDSLGHLWTLIVQSEVEERG